MSADVQQEKKQEEPQGGKGRKRTKSPFCILIRQEVNNESVYVPQTSVSGDETLTDAKACEKYIRDHWEDFEGQDVLIVQVKRKVTPKVKKTVQVTLD